MTFPSHPTLGVNQGSDSFRASQVHGNPTQLTVKDKKPWVLFQTFRLGSHFRTEQKAKGGGSISHYECMNSSLYNCLWSASSLVVKHERDRVLQGTENDRVELGSVT